MGFLKKLFGFGKKEEEKVDEEVIEEPIENKEEVNDEIINKPIETDNEDSIGVDDNNDDTAGIDKPSKITDEEPEENKEEINEEATQTRNFKYLDDLIHSGVKEIILDADIVLDDDEESDYKDGIKLDVDDLVIDGNGHSIDACRKARIFEVTGENITIKNIALKNGFVERSNGGAIYNKGTLTVSDSTLKGNKAMFGGAICNKEGGTLTVSDSILTGNTAQNSGAIDNMGELTVSDSTLRGNTAVYGGAICNGGELTITDSTLEGNKAYYDGGAIYNGGGINFGAGGVLTVSDSTLMGNTALGSGGAILNSSGIFKIFNCDFSNNISLTSIIYNRDSLQIFNSDFRSNGAPFIIENFSDLANVGIFNGEFKDNDIEESIIVNDGKSCTIEKTIFEKHPFNTIINKSDLTLLSPKIKDEGKLILNEKYILIRKSSDGLEDKIYGDGVVENEIFIPFEEKFDFGYLDKKIRESKTKEIILEEDVSFENYEIDYYEGGIELDMDNLIIDGNGHTIDAKEKTRIFYCTGKNITIKNLTLKNGHIHKNYDNPFNSNGGAIKINHNVNLTIVNCKFINNISEEDGGAIYNNGGELSVSDSILKGNDVSSRGGAIYNDDGGTLTVFESILNENRAKWYGGAIENSGGMLSVSDSTLKGNQARDGGAIHNLGGELSVSDSTLKGNDVSSGGGAIYNDDGKLSVSDSTLIGNTAQEGGVIYNSSELTILSSTLTKNTARNGGAIYNNKSGTLIVFDSTLQGNIAEAPFGGDGGAIYNKGGFFDDDGGELTVSDSTLKGNHARDGGAICNWGGTLSVSDSTLKGNDVSSRGGAIYNYNGTLIVSDSTLTENDGEAIYNNDGVLSVSDSTLQGKTIYNGGFIRKIHNVQLDEHIYNDGRLFVNEKFSTNLEKPIINKGHIITMSKDFVNIDDPHKIFELKSIEKNQKDFTYLNDLIQSGVNEIKLKNDIILNIMNNEDLIFKKGIKIDRNDLVIDGNGHIIDANYLGRIFYCTGKNITIKNIILKNGYSSSGGAIMAWDSGTLIVSDSKLQGNTAKYEGGAIYISFGSTLTLSCSILEGNTASLGGAIDNIGELAVYDSTLADNTAYKRGGAIYLNKNSKYESNNCTFKDNKPDDVYEEKE